MQSVSATLISQALDSGLLAAILTSGARLNRIATLARESVCKDLFKTLRQYLPYRSVLRSVARALREVDRLYIGEETVSPLWGPWITYKDTATIALVLKDDFDTM